MKNKDKKKLYYTIDFQLGKIEELAKEISYSHDAIIEALNFIEDPDFIMNLGQITTDLYEESYTEIPDNKSLTGISQHMDNLETVLYSLKEIHKEWLNEFEEYDN